MPEKLEESDPPPRFEDIVRAGLAGGLSQILVAAELPVRARLGSGIFSFNRRATPADVAAWTREVLGEATCGELEKSGQVERDLVAAARFTMALERRSGFDGGAPGTAGVTSLLPRSGPRPSLKAAKEIPPPETTEDGP